MDQVPDDVRQIAQRYASMDERALYALLLTEEELEGVAFSPGGRAAKGKAKFRMIWAEAGSGVCAYYSRHEKTFGNQIDLIALLTAPLLANSMLAGINAVALAALITKIGLGELCPKVG